MAAGWEKEIRGVEARAGRCSFPNCAKGSTYAGTESTLSITTRESVVLGRAESQCGGGAFKPRFDAAGKGEWWTGLKSGLIDGGNEDGIGRDEGE